MFAICIEASHEKGMGHLFRMLNLAKYLGKKDEDFIFVINDNEKTEEILNSKNIVFETVNLEDYTSNWEFSVIQKYKIEYWINDRLNTNKKHSLNVKNSNSKLITFDDLGSGSEYSDLNICGLFFNKENLRGAKVLKGIEYLILNSEIDIYKKERKKIEKVLVTLGGSDTYGVTIKVIKLLKKYNIKATIHTGPSFIHTNELEKELTKEYKLIKHVHSFIEEFSKYDLAITGGGITPFEANASGLPCLIVANELFEVQNGIFLDELTSSKFIGYHENIDVAILSKLDSLNINNMSKIGMVALTTDAPSKIYKEIQQI